MAESLITPFARTFALPSGERVRVRLARPGDRRALQALLRGRGMAADELALKRLLDFDPRDRLVLAAFALIDGADTLAAIGAIELHRGADLDTLVVDDRLGEGLGELLGSMLRQRAEAHSRRAA